MNGKGVSSFTSKSARLHQWVKVKNNEVYHLASAPDEDELKKQVEELEKMPTLQETHLGKVTERIVDQSKSAIQTKMSNEEFKAFFDEEMVRRGMLPQAEVIHENDNGIQFQSMLNIRY